MLSTIVLLKYVLVFLFVQINPNELSSSLNNNPEELSRMGEFPIDSNIVFIRTQDESDRSRIAYDGTNYFVVWHQLREDYIHTLRWHVFGSRVNRDGIVLDTFGIKISNWDRGTQYFPAIAFDGVNYMVVWGDTRYGSLDIMGARISQSGTVIDTAGFVISSTTGSQNQPEICFDGFQYCVAWEDNRSGSYRAYCARITTDGNVLDPNGIALGLGNNPSITCDGSRYFIVYHTMNALKGMRVDRNGIIIDTTDINISPPDGEVSYPSIAFDGVNYLTVWRDYLYPQPEHIMAARIDTAGEVLDSSGILITDRPEHNRYPVVKFSDGCYMTMWLNMDTVYSICGARLSTTGSLIDTLPLKLYSTYHYIKPNDIFIAGDSSLITLYNTDSTPINSQISGLRFQNTAIPIDTNPFVISHTLQINQQHMPAIASGSTEYFTAWEDNRNAGNQDIYGLRLNHTGIALDSSAIPLATTADSECCPSVAASDTQFLVAWSNGDILGCRVDGSGVVLDSTAIIISSALNTQTNPAASFDSINYLVAWSDGRNSRQDIYGSRITPAGQVLDLSFLIATSTEGDPSITFGAPYYLVVWTRNGMICGARVNRNGQVMDPGGIGIGWSAYTLSQPSASFDGVNYMCIWREIRLIPQHISSHIWVARINQAGVLLDPNGILIRDYWYYVDICNPVIAFDGRYYVTLWQDWSGLRAAKIDTSGCVVGTYTIVNEVPVPVSPAIAEGTNDSTMIVFEGWLDVWYQRNNFSGDRIWGLMYPFVGIEEQNYSNYRRASASLSIEPNPIKESGHIMYYVTQASPVKISLYDVSGRLVKPLLDTYQKPGSYGLSVDVGSLSAGLYFVYFKSMSNASVQKIIVVK